MANSLRRISMSNDDDNDNGDEKRAASSSSSSSFSEDNRGSAANALRKFELCVRECKVLTSSHGAIGVSAEDLLKCGSCLRVS